MPTVTGYVKRSPDACWRVLVDPSLLTGWIPGLRRARVVDTYKTGLAREIEFELATARSYSLVYTYDAAAGEIRWEPRGTPAVRGFARVEPFDGGTRFTYAMDPPDETPHDVDKIVAGFVTWMHAY